MSFVLSVESFKVPTDVTQLIRFSHKRITGCIKGLFTVQVTYIAVILHSGMDSISAVLVKHGRNGLQSLVRLPQSFLEFLSLVFYSGFMIFSFFRAASVFPLVYSWSTD